MANNSQLFAETDSGANFSVESASNGVNVSGNDSIPPGIPIAQSNVDLGALLPDPATFILPPPDSGEVTLGINDTFTDPGDGVDHVITGDVNGEADTDTDTFIFVPGSGDDTITDFRHEDAILNPDGTITSIPGDILDLSAYGIYGDDLDPRGYLGFFDTLIVDGLIDSYSVTLTDTVINFSSGDSLTLLGIGQDDLGTVIEENLVRDTGGGAV